MDLSSMLIYYIFSVINAISLRKHNYNIVCRLAIMCSKLYTVWFNVKNVREQINGEIQG